MSNNTAHLASTVYTVLQATYTSMQAANKALAAPISAMASALYARDGEVTVATLSVAIEGKAPVTIDKEARDIRLATKVKVAENRSAHMLTAFTVILDTTTNMQETYKALRTPVTYLASALYVRDGQITVDSLSKAIEGKSPNEVVAATLSLS
jgi:hypothetical protein